MAIIVHKYGGSSLASIELIQRAAERIIAQHSQGHQLVVVVSAMYGVTDHLSAMAHQLSTPPSPPIYDALLATGEQITANLLSLALIAKGWPATPCYAQQLGIITDASYNNANIISINPAYLQHELSQGRIVVAAGFQGITADGAITTLGRGGSDLTAVALAIALAADACYIYTDVDGVYTADPKLFAGARHIASIDFEIMLSLAELGSRVLQARAVALAAQHALPIKVLSSLQEAAIGTTVTNITCTSPEPRVIGISYAGECALITGKMQKMQDASTVKRYLNAHCSDYNIDKSNIKIINDQTIALILSTTELPIAARLIHDMPSTLALHHITQQARLVKIALVGHNLQQHCAIVQQVLRELAAIDIKVYLSTSAALAITLMVEHQHLATTIAKIHELCNL